jgi:septal ring factor EnvC (AmiA/AmiB activator)
LATSAVADTPEPAPARQRAPARRAAADASDFERLLSRAEAREKQLTEELAQIGPELQIVDKRMKARGKAYYRLVRAGLLPVGGGFDALVDHAAAVERLRAALGRDIELTRALKARLLAAREELKRLRAEKAPLLIQREAMQRASSAMRQADERQAAFLRAFGGGTSLPHVTVYGASGPAPEVPGARFSDQHGRLSFPLVGRAEALISTQPGSDDRGLVLTAPRDSAVRAVFAGRVAFAGTGTQGGTVVLDHGERYFTVYANLGHIEVNEGDNLAERARLGWIQRYGADSAALYFEVRRGEKRIEAAPWLGL